MSLDVDVPSPPPLGRRPVDADDPDAAGDRPDDPSAGAGRRDAIAGVLAEGAWADAFESWAADTHLTAAEFAVLSDHDLLREFDFYWDPEAETVRYHTPTVPPAVDRALDGDVEEVRAALDALGDVVAATIDQEYLVREEGVFEFSAGDTDPDFRDTE